MTLCWLIVVGNADFSTFGNDIHIAEVHAVRDVRKEKEVWVRALVEYAKPAAVQVCVSHRKPRQDAAQKGCNSLQRKGKIVKED